MNNSITKLPGQLTWNDFASNPIWGFIDDDDHELSPVDYPGYLIEPLARNVWLIACDYKLNDGTRLRGVINIRTTDHSPSLLQFPDMEGKFFMFPINSIIEGSVPTTDLTIFLGKSIEEIFPIRYVTKFVFKDGNKVEGIYNLRVSKDH